MLELWREFDFRLVEQSGEDDEFEGRNLDGDVDDVAPDRNEARSVGRRLEVPGENRAHLRKIFKKTEIFGDRDGLRDHVFERLGAGDVVGVKAGDALVDPGCAAVERKIEADVFLRAGGAEATTVSGVLLDGDNGFKAAKSVGKTDAADFFE